MDDAQIESTSKGTTAVFVRHQGDSGVANCGPGGAAGSAGDVVGALPAPAVSDSSGDPDTNLATVYTRYTVSGAAPTWTVTTVLDQSGLKAPERVFLRSLDEVVAASSETGGRNAQQPAGLPSGSWG